VPIAALTSRSAPGSKSSSRIKASPMSLSVVPNAAGLTKPSVPIAATTATRHGIKSSDLHASSCSLQHIRRSFLRRAGNTTNNVVLLALLNCYRTEGDPFR